jgi:hypothetical protein
MTFVPEAGFAGGTAVSVAAGTVGAAGTAVSVATGTAVGAGVGGAAVPHADAIRASATSAEKTISFLILILL